MVCSPQRFVDEAWKNLGWGLYKLEPTQHSEVNIFPTEDGMVQASQAPEIPEREFAKKTFPTMKMFIECPDFFYERRFSPDVTFDLWVWLFWSK